MRFNSIISLIKKFNVGEISTDSKLLKPGDIFFALQGSTYDGNCFINQALDRGALVVTDKPQDVLHRNVIVVEDIKLALEEAACYLYCQFPQKLVAVTGTNGKTSVVNYFQQLCVLTGRQAASIGTLGVITSSYNLNEEFKSKSLGSLTTPSYIAMRHILHKLSSNGVNFVSFEASSHGLVQGRLRGIKASAVAFTSFSRDHLDYHKTMEDYFQAKLKLFKENLINNGVAIINSDISKFLKIKHKLVQDFNVKLLTVGLQGQLKIVDIQTSLDKQKIHFRYENNNYWFEVPIIGRFQATNILIAMLLAINVGISLKELIPVLPNLKPVKGRLESVMVNNRYVFIDFAHTPEALAEVLQQLRELLTDNAKLIVVFGCGGDRDKAKRALMGEVAQKLSDYIIVTNDNPRSENPAEIRKNILQGAKSALEVADREEAIKYAISVMKKNDILLVAGKGHEDYQIIGNNKIYFSDIEIVKFYLNKLSNN